LIRRLGRWGLQEACRQLAEWQEAFPACARLTMSVNIPGRHLEDASLIDDVQEALAISGVHVQGDGNVCAKQLVATLVANDFHENFVEVQEAPLRRGNKNTFLDIFEEHAELIFGLAPFRIVLQHVNGAEAVAFGVMKI